MERELARISHLYIKKPKDFVQPTFPETLDSIVAIKVVVRILIPDQTHHVQRHILTKAEVCS